MTFGTLMPTRNITRKFVIRSTSNPALETVKEALAAGVSKTGSCGPGSLDRGGCRNRTVFGNSLSCPEGRTRYWPNPAIA